MKRKIYIASSWKMAETVMELAKYLRHWHEVFAFCEEDRGHFIFNARDWNGEDLSNITAKQGYEHPAFQKCYKSDKDGLDWCDTVVLLLPSGRSSHLEGGYAAGQGKDLYIYGEPVPGEFDAMYGFSRGVFEDLLKLKGALEDN